MTKCASLSIIKIILIVLLVASTYTTCNATIVYRKAELRDTEELYRLCDQLTSDDKKKLVIFPQNVRRKMLASQINKNKFFVACDTQKCGIIIAFLKLYLLSGPELNETLHDELCIETGPLVQRGSYLIPSEQIFNFGFDLILHEQDLDYELDQKKRTYIYYGGAYTSPEYRNSGIGTQLQREALSIIASPVLNHLRTNKAEQLCYVYGQVAANVGNKSMVRVFAEFIHRIVRPCFTAPDDVIGQRIAADIPIYLYNRAYEAFKPDFVMKHGELKAVFNEESKGQGNILIYGM